MPDDSPSHLITPPYPRSLVEPFLGIDSFSSTRGGFSDLRGVTADLFKKLAANRKVLGRLDGAKMGAATVISHRVT
jgi:hypothetical protein